MWKSRVKTVLIIRRNKMFSKIPAFYSKKLRNHLLKSSLHMYLLFNILTWFMNQVYLEKNIDDLIKEIDLFCCFKMCRLKTITFKLSNNIRKIYIFFHVKYDLQEKMFLIFSPSRQMYVPFEFVQFAVKRTLDLEELCNHAFFLVAE